MFKRPSEPPEDKGKSEPGYDASLEALRAYAENKSKEIEDTKNSLLDSYGAEGLASLSRRFENVNIEFTNHALIQSDPLYGIIHRSDARLTAVNSIAREASSLAQLFEKYARKPDDYSAANSRMEINKLLAELTNLKNASKSK